MEERNIPLVRPFGILYSMYDSNGVNMLKNFLAEVSASSLFEVPIFEGQILVRGRVLSPSEAEMNSLNSTLLISQVAPGGRSNGALANLRDLSSSLNGEEGEEEEDEALEKMLGILSKIRPEQLGAMSGQQDAIICRVVSHASMDKGATWEEMRIVREQSEQDSERNRLWVGMLPASDRSELLKKALSGHAEAVERLATFRG